MAGTRQRARFHVVICQRNLSLHDEYPGNPVRRGDVSVDLGNALLLKWLKHAAYAAKKVAQVDGHELSISYE